MPQGNAIANHPPRITVTLSERIIQLWVIVLLLYASPSTYGQNRYQVLHYFTDGSDGAHPLAGLTPAGDGIFFGTTNAGGRGWGDVFELSTSGTLWRLTPLYTFTPIQSNGNGPGNGGIRSSAPVVTGRDGNLYGTTEAGGNPTWSCGTVFRMSQEGVHWFYDVLYRFAPESNGCGPNGPVVFDQVGNIYGTTFSGGRHDSEGVVYKLVPFGGGWQESVIWTFGYGSDGAQPFAGLVMDPAGDLYGTTTAGGQYNWGTIFELSPSGSGWTEKVLYSFQNGADGGYPYAGLVWDEAGNLYGATLWGGQNRGGVIFELSPGSSDWNFSVVDALPANSGGVQSSLLIDSSGNLYGATRAGGPDGSGSVFKLVHASNGWIYSDLHDFDGNDGSLPVGSLIFDANGILYGTTDNGGLYPCEYNVGCGVVFKLTP